MRPGWSPNARRLMSDRAIALWGLVLGAIGTIVAVAALWVAWIVSPWQTRNDVFCYRTSETTLKCAYTRADCEAGLKPNPVWMEAHVRTSITFGPFQMHNPLRTSRLAPFGPACGQAFTPS